MPLLALPVLLPLVLLSSLPLPPAQNQAKFGFKLLRANVKEKMAEVANQTALVDNGFVVLTNVVPPYLLRLIDAACNDSPKQNGTSVDGRHR